jgi:hypothetical protein
MLTILKKELSTLKLCVHCRKIGISKEADYRVKGFNYETKIPTMTSLCIEHTKLLLSDGWELTILDYLSEKAKYEYARDLIKQYVNNVSIIKFLEDNPNIREGDEFLKIFYQEFKKE